MRRKVFAWVTGSDSRHLLIFVKAMGNSTLSIFVDESGRSNYRLFQLADLVCTLHLIERRLEAGDGMTASEVRFFGGPRDFKRNVLKKIKAKELV